MQSQSQLKTIYKDAADTIVGNCDTTLFLGGKEKSTLKEISELLGKETIDSFNQSENRGSQVSHGLNYQKLGKEPIDRAYYICQTYNRLGKNACTSHKIEARDLYNLVLKDIQELAAQAMKDADAFYQRLSSRMERRYLVDAS